MPRLIRTILQASLMVAPALFGGCASSGGATKPSGPVAVDGARYKLIAGAMGLDGRVVEFKKRGDGMMGCLVEPGIKLRNATGVELGSRVFSLKGKAGGNPNEYEGAYKGINPDGSSTDHEVFVAFDGENMTWNLESATWERQSGDAKMSEAEAKQCAAK